MCRDKTRWNGTSNLAITLEVVSIFCYSISLEEILKKHSSFSVAIVITIRKKPSAENGSRIVNSSKKRSSHEATLETIVQKPNEQQMNGVRPPSKQTRNEPLTLEDVIKALFDHRPPAEHHQMYSVTKLVRYFCDGHIKFPVYQISQTTVLWHAAISHSTKRFASTRWTMHYLPLLALAL